MHFECGFSEFKKNFAAGMSGVGVALDVLGFSVGFHPGREAQSVWHLTRRSGVLGSIPGLATYFRFSFRFFKKGSCQILAKVCARSTGQPLRRSKPTREKCGKVN